MLFHKLNSALCVTRQEVSSGESRITGAASGEWIARLAIVAVFGGLTVYTWAHWGDVDIDSGREMYVPAAIARGKVLYRDLWYPYGPLAPYLLAGLFRWLGASLNTLYAFGLATTLGFALLLFQVSRRFLPPAPAFLVSFCALMQSFQADIFDYVLPYSYSATVGSLIGMGCLYFVLRSVLAGSRLSLLAAGCCAGLALNCKPEFGFACYATMAFAVVTLTRVASPTRPIHLNALLCAPGLGAGLIAYVWMGIQYGAPMLLLEGAFRSQTRYFMQAYGAKWIADRGLRFHPAEILQTVALVGLSLLVWYGLVQLAQWAMHRRWVLWCVIGLGLLAATAGAMKFPLAVALYGYRRASEFVVFPSGMFWLACGVFFWATRAFLRQRNAACLGTAILCVYAMTAGIRVMAQVVPRDYAIFYNSALFLLFVMVLVPVIDRAAAGYPAATKARLNLSLVCLHAAWLGLLVAPYPKALPSRLATSRGVIYTRPAEAALFPRIISFIGERKAEGQTVMVLPEATSLYFFTGTDAPARWYQLLPGVLAPDEQDEFITAIERQRVDFILLSNRRTAEYGADYFGLDYNQRVYRWIQAHYEPAGQFGEFLRGKDQPFAMLIYRRRR